NIGRKGMTELEILVGVDRPIEWMRTSDQAMLRVCQASDYAIVGIWTGQGRFPIGGKIWGQEMIIQIEQAEMSPITAVKFLCLHQQHFVFAQRQGTELRDVRNALFLVDDQVVDGIQMFGTCLFDQILRSVVIVPTIIHVDMQVGAGEVAVLRRQAQWLERDRCRLAFCRDGDVSLRDRVVEAMRDLQPRVANRSDQSTLTQAVEVVVFKRLKAAIKAVVGMHPGIVGRISTPVGSKNTHSRWHSFAALVTHTQLEAADLF